MLRLLKGIWRVLSGISRAISVLVPLVFVAGFWFAFFAGMKEFAPGAPAGRGGFLIAAPGPLGGGGPPGCSGYAVC